MLNFYIGIPDAYHYYITWPPRPNPCPFAQSLKSPSYCLTTFRISRSKKQKKITFKDKCFKPNLWSYPFLTVVSQHQAFASITASLISRKVKENVNKIFFSIPLFPRLLPFSNKTMHIILVRPSPPILPTPRAQYFLPSRAQLYQRFLTQPPL